MKTTDLQNNILQNIKDLPLEALQEILDFVQFIRQKRIQVYPADNISFDLSQLNESELQHLEGEFINYKEIYPVNEPDKKE